MDIDIDCGTSAHKRLAYERRIALLSDAEAWSELDALNLKMLKISPLRLKQARENLFRIEALTRDVKRRSESEWVDLT